MFSIAVAVSRTTSAATSGTSSKGDVRAAASEISVDGATRNIVVRLVQVHQSAASAE